MIRAATPADVTGIARVQVASWRTTYENIVPKMVLENLSIEGRKGIWHRALHDDQQITFVALEGEEIVGFANGGEERSNDPVHDSELYAIYLLLTYQRRGLGRELVGAVASALKARGHTAMLTWVLRDNPSRAFYESIGGQFLREKDIEIGGARLKELAYGWTDLGALERNLTKTVLDTNS